MSLKLQQLAVRGKVPRDVRESCLTGPGCAGTREHIRGGKKEKGNRIKGKSSLNTKGGLGKSSTPSCQCPEDGTGLPRAKQPGGDGDTGRLRERTGSPRWCRGVAFQQPAQHRCVKTDAFPWEALPVGWVLLCHLAGSSHASHICFYDDCVFYW